MLVEHDFYLKLLNFATLDLNAMEWPCPCTLWRVCHLAHPNMLTCCLTQNNGQGLDQHNALGLWPFRSTHQSLVKILDCLLVHKIQQVLFNFDFWLNLVLILGLAIGWH
jgi:hypothetical protein